MDPEAFRAAAHDVVDRIADYLAGRRAAPRAAADRARIRRPAVPGPRARRARIDRRHPRGRRPPRDPERDALAAPGVHGLLREHGVGPGPARGVPDRRAGPEPDAVADVADRDGARDRGRRLAARGARAAGDVRRAAHRHRVHLVADRAGLGARGIRARCRGLRARGARARGRAACLRLDGGPQLDRQGVHDARASDARRSSRSPSTRRTRWTPRRCRRRSRRTITPAGGPWRSSRRSGPRPPRRPIR